MKLLPVLLGLSWLLVGGISIAGARERVVRLPSGERIAIDVPMGYSFKSEVDAEGKMLVKMENPIWEIAIALVFFPERDPKITTEEWQRNTIITTMAGAMGQSAESDYKFKALGPSSGTGQYCVFTQSGMTPGQKLPPGEYKHLTGGVRAWPGMFVLFQLLSNDVSTPEYREAFELLRTGISPE